MRLFDMQTFCIFFSFFFDVLNWFLEGLVTVYHTEIAKCQQWFGLVYPYNMMDANNRLYYHLLWTWEKLMLNQLLLTLFKMLCVNAGLSGGTKSSGKSMTHYQTKFNVKPDKSKKGKNLSLWFFQHQHLVILCKILYVRKHSEIEMPNFGYLILILEKPVLSLTEFHTVCVYGVLLRLTNVYSECHITLFKQKKAPGRCKRTLFCT